jgi:hypothetical protein
MPNWDRLSKDELESLRAEKKRELARVVRQKRDEQRLLRLLKSVSADMERIEDMHYGELMTLRSKLNMLKELPDLSEEELASINEWDILATSVEKARKIVEHELREVARQAKLAQNREEPTQEVEAPKCIVCGKRERHFGDYCKRCVPDELRPKGKVV